MASPSPPRSTAPACSCAASDLPSLYGAVVQRNGGSVPSRRLRKRTLIEVSRAIEDEALSHGTAPICFGAFQEERFYRRVEPRWRRLGAVADAAAVFADFPRPALRSARAGRAADRARLAARATSGRWSSTRRGTRRARRLGAARERPRGARPTSTGASRRYWTLDPIEVRAATRVGAALAREVDEEFGDRVDALLADRPLAFERPAIALTALTNRVVSYLDEVAV